MTSAVDAASLERLMEALEEALHETGRFLTSTGNEPTRGSIAAQELVNFPRREFVLTAYCQGDMLLEGASELVTCFIRTCAEPALPIASWSTVRAAIESCALASWLLSPGIDVRTRVKRSFAFRFEGLDQQARMARAMNRPGNLEAIIQRINEVEQTAISVGFDKIVNSQERRIGIGQVMPSITSIVADSLDEEVTYRLLSAVTHAHHWAVHRLGFDVLPINAAAADSNTMRPLKKAAKPICFQYLTDQAMKAFTTPVMYKTKLFGGDHNLLLERIRYHEHRIHALAKAIEFVPEEEEVG
jgi:hypothetical protein